MRAWVLDEVGNINLREVSKPKLTMSDVLVEVKAAGICGSDIPRIYTNGAHRMPLIIGHEFAGQVVCAPGAGKSWLNKRVGVFPLIPCRSCLPCRQRKYEMCRSYDYLGSRSDGAFADYVVVPRTNLIELDDDVSFMQAAMLEPMAVAAHSIRALDIENADSVCILGLGTIGLMTAMFLIEMIGEEKLYVVGNKDFQKEKALELGIKEENYIDGKNEKVTDSVFEKTGGNGVSRVFECVGKNETLSQAVTICKPGGALMLVGNPYTDMTLDRDIYWKILRNQLTVKGTWNSSFLRDENDDWHFVMDKLAKGKIHPERFITHQFSIDELDRGFEIMKNKTEDYVKIMMVM